MTQTLHVSDATSAAPSKSNREAPAWARVIPLLLFAMLGLPAACGQLGIVSRDSTATPDTEALDEATSEATSRAVSAADQGGFSQARYLPSIVQPVAGSFDLSRFATTRGQANAGAGSGSLEAPASSKAPNPADAGPIDPPPGPAAACPGIAVRQGDALAIDGQPFVFFGVNARYLMDNDFPEAEVEPILQRLRERGVNTVRVWYFHDEDPERFARLLDAGNRQRIRFVVAMADNVHKGVDWFFGEEDEEKVRPYVEETVSRFRDRPEILFWEPINEPNCGHGRYDDACLDTLRNWLQMMAGRIKRIDPCRVVSTSVIGAGNYENEQSSYRKLHRKDAVEVFSAHRRTTDEGRLELEMAQDAGRPIVYGEIYDEIYDEGCQVLGGDRSPGARAERVKDDLRQAVDEGVDGYLLWDLAIGRVRKTNGDDQHYCSRFGFGWDDPLWEKLNRTEGLPPAVPWR